MKTIPKMTHYSGDGYLMWQRFAFATTGVKLIMKTFSTCALIN